MSYDPANSGKLGRTFLFGLALIIASVSNSLAAVRADVEKAILSTFEQINQVPRCSKDEGGISAWLVRWAQDRKFQVTQDPYKNVLITLPATPGWEGRPGVVLQSHMDMVCLKTEGSSHDFTKDPIPLVRDRGWIRAKDTTLGADDGIGIAIALTLAEMSANPRPRLEILITADEERDMTGAIGFGANMLTGARFINLDSESDSVLTLGSAGGLHTEVKLPLAVSPLPKGAKLFRLKVSGLIGGHSGVDISKGRASANVLMAMLLAEAGSFRLVSLNGGTAPNVIATSAEATVTMDKNAASALKRRLAAFTAKAKRQYPGEQTLSITLTTIKGEGQPAASPERSQAAAALIASIPQGVSAWSREFAGLPETSNNIGIVRMMDGVLEISTFQRSFHSDNLRAVSAQIESAANANGASSKRGEEFPAWPPKSSTGLAKATQNAYKKLFGSEMAVQVIHAGLECGNFAVKYPAMEMISIGPTLRNAHSTSERVKVASLRKIWRLLEEILQAQ